jgi:hypothetical protein
MGKETKITNKDVIDLHSAINGTTNNMGQVLFKGLLQFEDHSEGFSLTLKVMKIAEKISVVWNAWEHILKESSSKDKGTEDKQKFQAERQTKLEKFLQADATIEINDNDKITIEELNKIKGDKNEKPTGQLLFILKPVLKFK